MVEADEVITDAIYVHPILLLGVGVGLIAVGSVLSQTLFVAISAVTGLSVLASSLVWVVLSLVTALLGFLRSVEVDDAQ